MSNRYGKNQKRKHRERLAALERETAALKPVMHRHIELLDRVQEWDAEIRRGLGELSAFRFAPQTRELQGATRDGVTVSVPKDLSTVDIMAWDPQAEVSRSMTMTTQRLAALRVESHDDVMQARRLIAVISQRNGQRLFFYNYALDKAVEMNVRRHERQFLAAEITALFCDHRDQERRAAE